MHVVRRRCILGLRRDLRFNAFHWEYDTREYDTFFLQMHLVPSEFAG